MTCINVAPGVVFPQAHGIILNRFSPGGLKRQESYGGPLASAVIPVDESGSFVSE